MVCLLRGEQKIGLLVAFGYSLLLKLQTIAGEQSGQMMLQTLSCAALSFVQHLVGCGDEVLNGGEAAGNHVAVAGVFKGAEQPVFDVRPFDQLAVGIGKAVASYGFRNMDEREQGNQTRIRRRHS